MAAQLFQTESKSMKTSGMASKSSVSALLMREPTVVIHNCLCFFLRIYFISRVSCLCIFVYTTCMPSAWGDKEATDPLELRLQTVVICHVHTGNWTWVLLKNSQCSLPLKQPSSPTYLILKYVYMLVSMCMWLQVPTDDRRGYWVPCIWGYRHLWGTWHRHWEPNLGPL